MNHTGSATYQNGGHPDTAVTRDMFCGPFRPASTATGAHFAGPSASAPFPRTVSLFAKAPIRVCDGRSEPERNARTDETTRPGFSAAVPGTLRYVYSKSAERVGATTTASRSWKFRRAAGDKTTGTDSTNQSAPAFTRCRPILPASSATVLYTNLARPPLRHPSTAMKTRPRSVKKAPAAMPSPQGKRRTFTPATNVLLMKSWRAEVASYAPYGSAALPRSVPLTGQKFAGLIANRMRSYASNVVFTAAQVLGKIKFLRGNRSVERARGLAIGDMEKQVKEVLAMEDAVARAVQEEQVAAARVVQQVEKPPRHEAGSADVNVVQYNPPRGDEAQERPQVEQNRLIDEDVLVPARKAKKRSKKRIRPPAQSKDPDPEECPVLEKRKRLTGGGNGEGNVVAGDIHVEEARVEPQMTDVGEERYEETQAFPVKERAEYADKGREKVGKGREKVGEGRENVDDGRGEVEERQDAVEDQFLTGNVEIFDDRGMPPHDEEVVEDGVLMLDQVRELERQVKLEEIELLRDKQNREKERRDDEIRWSRKKRLLEQLRSTSEVLYKIGMRPMVEKLMLRACRLLEEEKL